jgi:predicted nucleotidyltransferase
MVTRPSKTSSTTFEELIRRLRTQDVVDGLIVVGSAARDELHAASDYDLVILMSEMPVPIDMGVTFVDQRNTDLIFITTEELDDTIESSEPLNPYTFIGRAFLRMDDGRIELDRSGRLQKARQKLSDGVTLKLLDTETKHLRWWLMNMFLRVARRIVQSNDPVYLQAAELHLTGMLDYAMTDYFNFRNILFKGEKDAVRYWSENDPDMLRLFMDCLKEQDLRSKLNLYEQLAGLAASPMGGVWDTEVTSLHVRSGNETIESDIPTLTSDALDFWETLVAPVPA